MLNFYNYRTYSNYSQSLLLEGRVCQEKNKHMAKRLISSQAIVEKFNIPYTTVTHYTNLGFFTVVRKKGNRRLYDERQIRMHLKKIAQLVNEGYPLRLIRKKLIG